jgi:hypothetical protein
MNALTRVYKACVYCLTHPFFRAWRITPLAVTDNDDDDDATCTMCELKAYIYQQCRHRGPAAVSQPCPLSRQCLTETDPFELELVLQELPGFCPDCESWAEETGEPPIPYVPPRVGDMLSARDLALGPLELEATTVEVRTFRHFPVAAAETARSHGPPAPEKTPRRRRRHTDGEITPNSSAFRPYDCSPIHRPERYDSTLTPVRASQGSLPQTPLASSPPHGQKRSYAAANQTPAGHPNSDDVPEPRSKRPKSSSSASSGKSSAAGYSDAFIIHRRYDPEGYG